MIERQIGRDPPRPSSETARGVESRPRPINFPKRFQRQFFSHGRVARNPEDPAINIAMAFAKQGLKSFEVSERESLEPFSGRFSTILFDAQSAFASDAAVRQFLSSHWPDLWHDHLQEKGSILLLLYHALLSECGMGFISQRLFQPCGRSIGGWLLHDTEVMVAWLLTLPGEQSSDLVHDLAWARIP